MIRKIFGIILIIILSVIFIFGATGAINTNSSIKNPKTQKTSNVKNTENKESSVETNTNNTQNINDNKQNTANNTQNIASSAQNTNVSEQQEVVNQNQQNTQVQQGIESTIRVNLSQYYTSLVQAINQGNFGILAPSLYPNGPLYEEQQSYVPKVYNEGIQEEYVSSTISGFQFANNNKTVVANVSEVFNITYQNGTTKTKGYNWKYTFKYYQPLGSYLIYSMN